MISVIVPVYNAEKYIRETIHSILNQDFADFEILLINDGSKDKSLEICNELALKYPQIRVFDQKNSGVSAARNKGLLEARGEYIAFADADDLLEKDMLSTLYNCAKEYNADVVSCGAGLVEDGKIIKEEYGTNTIKVYDSNEALKFFLAGNRVNIGVWTKLFKKDLIKDITFLKQASTFTMLFLVSLQIPWISATALDELLASSPISSATIENPRPASPALALSIEAFKASKLVWLEIWKIIPAISSTSLVFC